MPKYSIILPVRNGGEYVKDCIHSILKQTFTDFDLIVLDNCSTDGTREWISALHEKKISIIPSQTPLSIEENWGRIKDVRKNEFITLIGHDDILYPEFLESIEKMMQKYPTASLYHTHFDFIDAAGKVTRRCKPMPAVLTGNDLLKMMLVNNIDQMGTGYVMRSSDYDLLGGIPVKYPNLLYADFELWLRLALQSYEAISPENCFAFRVHKSTTGLSQDKKLHTALKMFVEFLTECAAQNKESLLIIKQFSHSFLAFYCKGYAHRLLRTSIKERDGLSVKDFISETKQLAIKLGVQDNYKPEKISSIKLAMMIDSNLLSRKLFLLFKKIYSKPVMG
ncbi:MAG: glycosyltransferase [Ferruginibacter sp.]